jgi:hypothetical protein
VHQKLTDAFRQTRQLSDEDWASFVEPWFMFFHALAEMFIFSLIVSQVLLISISSSKFSKDANLFEILTWHFSLTYTSFNFLDQTSPCKHRALLIHCQSLPNVSRYQIVIRITVCCPERSGVRYIWMPSHVYENMVNSTEFISGDAQVNLWMLRCGNIVLLTVRLSDVVKFTTLTALSLLTSCKLLSPVIGLQISSLPTSALKSPNKCSYGI